MENLWPDFSAVAEIETPKKILQEQATNLQSSTFGLLKATIVETKAKPDMLSYQFKVIAPFVGNYSVNILRIDHSVYLYPLDVYFYLTEQLFSYIPEEEFPDVLKRIFNHERTIRVIKNLLAQSMTEKSEQNPFQ